LPARPNLKGCELANDCCADRKELIATAKVGSIRARRDPDLRGFLPAFLAASAAVDRLIPSLMFLTP
jgi:hypothetical protein